jgi:hypothetical protein
MYTGTNSAWREQLQFDPAAANQMFTALKNDQPFTAGSSTSTDTTTQASSTPSTTTSSAPAVNVAAVRAEVQNASGISGRASTVRDALVSAGFSSSELTVANASQNSSTTAVYYPSDRAQSAQSVAAALGIPSSSVHESSAYSEVTVRIGADWASGSLYTGSTGGASSSGSTAPTTVASSPPASSLETNGADTKACMYVAQPEW